MCNRCIIEFSDSVLSMEEIEGKRVIEVGSLIDNSGNLRPHIEQMNPLEYIGIDIFQGVFVDVICSAEKIIEKFGKEKFDVCISTEVLEHIKDWKLVISNMKNIVKKNGIILLTARSKGFHYHGRPFDFWRFEIDDMRDIFSDCIIQYLETDTLMPGVMIKVIKPMNFEEKDLSNIKIYSMERKERI